MIQLQNISFHYKKGQPLFQGLDLSIPAGNIYGLLGRNGAGKTTLLSILAGFLEPKDGQCTVGGQVPFHRSPEFLADLFFIPEELYIPAISIKSFVKTYAPFYPKFDHSQMEGFISEFGLDMNRKITRLSYGQKKKVMIGFGLATNCSLLILDEPTNGLDIPSKSQFRKLLAGSITPDRTFLISTHQVRDMANLIDPIIVLHQGKIIFKESIESIAKKLQFELQYSTPGPEVLYAERVPGGYMTIQPNQGMESPYEEIDIEILFNAIIENSQQFSQLFKTEINHEYK